MDFKKCRDLINNRVNEFLNGNNIVGLVVADKEKMWETYLESFPPEFNQIFRERRSHDCNYCKNFIRNIGNLVIIKDNKVQSIWDIPELYEDEEYGNSVKAMRDLIHSSSIEDYFFVEMNKYGMEHNFEMKEGFNPRKWEHLYCVVPKKYVTDSVGAEKGKLRDIRNVFKRSLDEITEEAIETVIELINQNSLYKGEEWKNQLTEFLKFKKVYDKLYISEREVYAWEQSVKVGAVIGKIKNHSIGTLLTNISEGMDLDLAVKKYEAIVAPENYKRPKAVYTKKMLEEAEKTIIELGYINSLGRRYANINDITINNILFANRDSVNKITCKSIFDEMKKEVTNTPKKFEKVEEITVEKFIKDVLPSTKELGVYLENKHSKNLMSLIAPSDKDSNIMFKWDNNFSWAYTGNITDSSMKENVKNAGGKVEGDLRFSIQWNDITPDTCDLDAHCVEIASNYTIYFSNKGSFSPNRGKLDVDIIRPSNTPAVENIIYENRNTMKDGDYEFYVNHYSGRTTSGFRAEIEFDGQIYQYDVRDNQSGKIKVATVNLKNGIFTLKENIKSTTSSKDIWGLNTNNFIPVSIMMFSPNYWNEQQGIGNKHYFFMLKDCINPEQPQGFYNEFLKEGLMKHKRVFEALGNKMRVQETENQLSGLGFSSTQRNEVIVKVKGTIERVLKIKI
jgi:hypothetical protein